MHKMLIASLLVFASSGGWSQGTSGSNGQPPTPGSTTGVSAPTGGQHGTAVPVSTFQSQCLTNLAGFASEKLQAQLLKDKAVTNQVRLAAQISVSQLGAACEKVCSNYALISNKISWALVSPGFLSEPEHTLQTIYKQMPKPALPGKAELATCLPQQATLNWCPPSGSGIGAGSSRIENPLDKIRVCSSGFDALKNMNFTAADAAHNCARPNIVDAETRIKEEHQCVADAAKADMKAAADKAAADKAAANGNAQLPKGPMGLMPSNRQKP